MSKKLNLIFAFALIAMIGCSKSPKEYNGQAPAKNDFKEQNIPSFEKPFPVIVDGQEKPSTDLITSLIDGEEKIDAKKTFNSRQPIIYTKLASGSTFISVAGINLKTTLQEASLILTPPPFGVNSKFQALYEEGLYIQWRRDDPQTPDYIIVLNSYLGEMQVPVPGKPIRMNHDFSKEYDEGTEAGAQAIARDYYRLFENKDAKYDCIAEATCNLIWGDSNQKDFFFEIPGRMLWMISKDRFLLYRMLLQKANPLGVLASNVDLLKGEFLVADQKTVSLGTTFEAVEKQQKEYSEQTSILVEPDAAVSVDTLSREYDGVNLGYLRRKFDRKDETPQPTDPMQYFLVYGSFANPFLLNGKMIVVTETASDVTLVLEEPQKVAPEPLVTDLSITSPLVLKMEFKKENVKIFAQKSADLIRNELATMFPGAKIASRITGEFKRKSFKDYTVSIYAFNTKANDGIYIQYTIGEEQGNIYGIFVSKLGGIYNSIDMQMIDTADQPVQKVFGLVVKKDFKGKDVLDENQQPVMIPGLLKTYTQLAGFNIGEKITVKNWDLGRNEANMLYSDKNKQEHNLRVPYFDIDSGFFAFGQEAPSYQDQSTIDVGNLGARLGLKKVSETDVERVYQIMNITTSYAFGDVQGLCGSAALKVSLGISVEAFQKLMSTSNCKGLEYYRADGTKALQFVYFPEERIRFNFEEDALSSLTIYAREDEVK